MQHVGSFSRIKVSEQSARVVNEVKTERSLVNQVVGKRLCYFIPALINNELQIDSSIGLRGNPCVLGTINHPHKGDIGEITVPKSSADIGVSALEALFNLESSAPREWARGLWRNLLILLFGPIIDRPGPKGFGPFIDGKRVNRVLDPIRNSLKSAACIPVGFARIILLRGADVRDSVPKS